MLVFLMLFGLVQAQAFFISTSPLADLQYQQAAMHTSGGTFVLDLPPEAWPSNVAASGPPRRVRTSRGLGARVDHGSCTILS